MATIHFLNVGKGDCSVIQHSSGRVSVVDVCNAEIPHDADQASKQLREMMNARQGILGNFNQKDYPVNPILYLWERDIKKAFRFILTHPDMDHMDGIRDLFIAFNPPNFWDTNNNAEKDFSGRGPYREEDWEFYQALRDGDPGVEVKRLALHCGDKGKYWLQNDLGEAGDGLTILAPTPALVVDANQTKEYNDCSYVLVYRPGNRKIVFAGDSHNKTWEHILENDRSEVRDADLLIAPHHGRHSDRSFEFLDVVNPKLTFFGYAESEHLAYNAWHSRGLPIITNNQAGSMIIDVVDDKMKLHVTHRPFAERQNPSTTLDNRLQAYYCGDY